MRVPPMVRCLATQEPGYLGASIGTSVMLERSTHEHTPLDARPQTSDGGQRGCRRAILPGEAGFATWMSTHNFVS